MSVTPYLTSEEAYAVTKRLEKKGLLDAEFWVQLLPTTLPNSDKVHFVLRYYASEEASEPIALVHFMDNCEKKSKSTVFIEQLQQMLSWRWGEFKPNFMLMRKLPTLANTRRYKLQLLLE